MRAAIRDGLADDDRATEEQRDDRKSSRADRDSAARDRRDAASDREAADRDRRDAASGRPAAAEERDAHRRSGT
jgi:hypothetical protein